MSVLKNVSIDYKIIGFFGVTATIISLFVGMISGVAASDLFIRILIILPVFSGMGFGIIYILKRFVPEAYDMLTNSPNDAEELTDADSEMKEEEYSSEYVKTESESESTSDDEEKSEFKELTGNDFQEITDNDIGVSDKTFSGSEGQKLGKHLVSNEKFGNYEPKIMAEAVRTMMSKDED